ncbi:NAD(P)-dependent oxidoreductase [Streptomyces candidus]|uniref:3-hydroxyisobutyrate dehydrogenase-like beta-hydroxyacid dehydrogenase n=1 Tax=Streptomyces candidus TaxID=67283 RepID=A0A7X0HCV2_9ACTN|nr:NAD(P)-binding domain-containing protein [Streptomyces candidus]MBB6435234.1 3-hydroxyisobutyrate dehydrogenase-like beta-hydroxyacid dehydrogenase [Streptomyces candidus]GHH40349.1 6-phosphogluconate dehydrogenase [Streptomyces candidus]
MNATTDNAVDAPVRAAVTVLGLGPMGQALARAFLVAGHPTTVWNRTPSRADSLVAAGAVRAATPAEAAHASGLVVVCVLNHEAALAILDTAGDALKGRTVVNLTADTPVRAREAADWAQARGVTYLDGAIMTPTGTIGTPHAVFLHSGPADAYEAHRATLGALGGTATHLGPDPTRAASHEVALLDLWWTSISGLVHSFALARAYGVAATDLAPFAKDIGNLVTGFVDELAKDADSGEYPGDESDLASAATAMAHIAHATEEAGLDATVLRAAQNVADRAVAAGHGQDNMLGMLAAITRPTP